MDKETAEKMAAIVGGVAEQSGRNVWTVYVLTAKGRLALGDESWGFEFPMGETVVSSELVY
jgi:hypothetical protein